MSTKDLSTYLNDHLAGSVAALEMLDHLIEAHTVTPLGDVLSALRAAIDEDQAVLQSLVQQLAMSESVVRKATAWLAEKGARLKLSARGSEDERLELLEALEALGLGIEGKRSLWRALARVSSHWPAIAALDLERLERRATEQREILERERLSAAERAFGQ